MSFEEILKTVEIENKKELEKLKNLGILKSREIMESFEKKANEKANIILKEGERERESFKKQHLLNAYLEQRKRILARKQKACSKIIEKVMEKIVALPDVEYKEIMKSWLKQSVETGNETIFITKRDRERLDSDFLASINAFLIQHNLQGNLIISSQFLPDDLLGGFILERGKIRIDMTLVSMIKEKQNKLELIVAENLFRNPDRKDVI